MEEPFIDSVYAGQTVPTRQVPTRVSPEGKFLKRGDERFLVTGVAYGTFAPGPRGDHFPPLSRVEDDFAMMARHRINTIRTYTVPDSDVLDCALEHGLQVMVGLAWPQYTAFLDDRRQCREIRHKVQSDVRRLGEHPAVLLVALGNEIPASIVRWHGAPRVAGFLHQLFDVAKDVAPETLLTYVNFPPTEYLELPFLDVCAFNVYLHEADELRAYMARLQHIAGPKPLLLAEAGADSLRASEDGQAHLTALQLRAAYEAGACGAVAFTWTDEWWRGGFPIEDWAFGLVTADRRPKPALKAVSRVFVNALEGLAQPHSPSVSVVVCAYNAADTIDDCLTSLMALRYPHLEIVVVNDGSTDRTGELARRYNGVRLIEVPNGGLAAARNIGASHATGDIIAYTDADVRVDPDWLTYLVKAFEAPEVVAAGGPNVVPPDDPFLAQCVARAPGGPTHVMLDDHIAEHVPGCNLAMRRDALAAIGGFNRTFLRAGDDVDVCWRLQARGWKIAFVPNALVWHHHRASVRAYWRQQVGYGEGEAWLMPYHPDKFAGARPFWRGCIYAPTPWVRPASGKRVNAGVWGTAAFPSVYHTSAHPLVYLPHSPQWQLGALVLLVMGLASWLTDEPRAATVLMAAGAAAVMVTVGKCIDYAVRTDVSGLPPVRGSRSAGRLAAWAIIAWLHFLQPLARLHGQVRGRRRPPRPTGASTRATVVSRGRSTPWTAVRLAFGKADEQRFWGEASVSAPLLLERVVRRLRLARLPAPVELDSGWWHERDISVPVGGFARVDLRLLVEDHGAGKCLVRAATRLRLRSLIPLIAAAAIAAAIYGASSRGPLPEVAAALVVLAGLWPLAQATRIGGIVQSAVRDVATAAGMQVLREPGVRNRPGRRVGA